MEVMWPAVSGARGGRLHAYETKDKAERDCNVLYNSSWVLQNRHQVSYCVARHSQNKGKCKRTNVTGNAHADDRRQTKTTAGHRQPHPSSVAGRTAGCDEDSHPLKSRTNNISQRGGKNRALCMH